MFETVIGIAIGYAVVSAIVGLFIGSILAAIFNGYSGLNAVIAQKDSEYFARIIAVRSKFRKMRAIKRLGYTILTFFVGFVVAAAVWPATVISK
jgi:uncharacterized membrane protein